jgi:hypothetical protein
MEMLVEIHSVLRWVVLVVGVGALVLAGLAATGTRPWDRVADRAAFFFPLAMDVQALVGIVLWVLGQRWTTVYLGWIHPLAMIAALGLAHAGRARSERADASRDRGRQAVIFFGASLVVVLLAIPLYSWPL